MLPSSEERIAADDHLDANELTISLPIGASVEQLTGSRSLGVELSADAVERRALLDALASHRIVHVAGYGGPFRVYRARVVAGSGRTFFELVPPEYIVD